MFPDGHRLHDPELPPATLTPADLDRMKQAVLLGEDDVAALRRSGPILSPQTGDDRASVDAMQNAWRKSVLLQVTLWSEPYVLPGDY